MNTWMNSNIIHKTITSTFLERVRQTPKTIGFQFKPPFGEATASQSWKTFTYKEFYEECRLISFGLMGLGIEKEDKVAILSNTRIEWALCDMAIMGARGITVPIYASNTADDVEFISSHSEAKIIFVEDVKQLQKFLEKKKENPNSFSTLKKVVSFDLDALKIISQYPEFAEYVISLFSLKEIGQRQEGHDPLRFENNLKAAEPDDIFTICYTSGTTGIPKGVMLSQDNLMSAIEGGISILGSGVNFSNETVLSFLPYSHIFGRYESLFTYSAGWRLVFAENLDRLVQNIEEVKPTIIFAVPRIFEKIYSRIQVALDQQSLVAKEVFARAFQVGKRYFQAKLNRDRPSAADILSYRVAKSLVFQKVAQKFGGKLKFAVSGGAPLSKEIGEFFQVIGIPILEGYGLTETCAPITVNSPNDVRFGVVGRPMPEVSIRIAEDGEILVKSRKVFKGYYKMPKETEEVLKDGWFHTGDIGHIDSDGFLHITDRKKDLIITSAGKNIAPQKIENLAKTQKLFTQFVVFGDRKNFLTALVTLDRDQIIKYANDHQILFSEYSELIKNPKIIFVVQKMVEEMNKRLASYETIKKFVILPNEFSVPTGELTPSLKIKRSQVYKLYGAEISSMYQNQP